LASFRRWLYSEDFPDLGEISYLRGEIRVDLSREELFSHNQVGSEFIRVLGNLVRAGRLGRFCGKGIYLSHEMADFACLPDSVAFSDDTLRSGRLRIGKKVKGDYIELEGTPDTVLEVVNASSVGKDTEVLHDLYWQAGIPEYWLVDARGERLVFDIFQHGRKGHTATRKQGGWLKSKVFGKSFRLTRQDDALGHPEYTLEVR